MPRSETPDESKSASRGRKGKGATKGSRKAKPQGRGKPKRKRPSHQGTTQKARERAAGLVPSKTVRIITSDPLRAQIVAVALQRLYAPSDFARDVGIALNVASYAFKVLKDNGILELVKKEKVQGATIKHLYRATEAALVSAANWGLLDDELRPGITGTTLHDFNARASQAQETGHMFLRDDFCLYWTPADLDEIAWEEQVEFIDWFIEASKDLVVQTANRRASGKGKGSFHATVAIAAFPSPTHEEVKEQLESELKMPPDKLRYHVGRLDAHGLACGAEWNVELQALNVAMPSVSMSCRSGCDKRLRPTDVARD